MTDPRDIWFAGFCTGAAFVYIGAMAGWIGPTERTNNGLWNKQHRRDRGRDRDWRRSFNHENTNRPSGPPQL